MERVLNIFNIFILIFKMVQLMCRGGGAQLVDHRLQPGSLYSLWVYVSVLLLVRLEIVIVRWRLARPGHVSGCKNEPWTSSRRFVSGSKAAFGLK